MIDDYYNEEEQWERVKRWLRENGPWLIAGVIIGLGALAAWRWYEAYVERRHVEASVAFSEILQTLERGDRVAAIKAVDELSRWIDVLVLVAGDERCEQHRRGEEPGQTR